ncbi:sodium-dependent transporter bedraggled isoform X2 [Leptidea sinapis]|uniref:sodium-dependent transporter bedraggled isoform X2 n=1 Tax=Leptidea sinapis TaxID=189913 RepID=UPI0021401672|nr:sodium-dependent transporter bedraggled isoform X2 [Leptidea sinapis]
MDIVNMDEGWYEPKEIVPSSGVDSDASSSAFESYDMSAQTSDTDRQSDDDDLKEDLQKNIPECYKSDSNFTTYNMSTDNDEEFQATALCQFMDILNDLDEVLDKSLLACLDDTEKSCDSDEDDLICKIRECFGERESLAQSQSTSSDDDNTQVVCASQLLPSSQLLESNNVHRSSVKAQVASLGRSKSFAELSSNSERQQTVPILERASTTNDNLRSSMRRLDPIILPAMAAQEPQTEALTLPVILFLEHHVNLRPTSAPIQLQVTAANLSQESASGPLIVGRRTLLMNRTLSLPSPGDSEITGGDWTSRNTARSTARSTSVSSSSSESLAGAQIVNQSPFIGTDDRNDDIEETTCGVWPHRMSAMLACFSCTVGIFNISRFAMFSVHFGASFIIQFSILSLIAGIPLFTLHLCLGQVLESGPIDMWRISPIFQGVGISLLLSQAFIGIYSIIGLSWILVYFRDSFITADDKYRWALPHEFGFEDSAIRNTTNRIQETVPQYFHGEVLQRNLSTNNFGTIKFQVAFNLAVVWMIVFVSLSKGLRSYGKAVYMLIFLPICGTLVLCTKLLTMIPYDKVTNIFAETEWSEFFVNSNSWAAAVQETFLTWGLLGACVMQLTSHKDPKHRRTAMLQKESACIVAFTFAVLLLGSFLANTCMQILKNYGYVYIPGSYETIKSSQILWPISEPLPGNTVSTPVRYMGHYGSLVGVTVWKSGNIGTILSGWQPLELATHVVPATLAVLPSNVLSPAWAVIFYFILIMFGLAQQLAIWYSVITGIVAINAEALRVWETTITFFSCVFGLAMGLLLSTDAICVMDFRVGQQRQLYSWRKPTGYWSVWSRQVAVLVQQGLLVLVPAAAFVQTWRYMSKGPNDILERVQNLYRPRMGEAGVMEVPARRAGGGDQAGPRPAVAAPDPPPKYTPPPSYSTATGARLLNTLRRSFRTLRRITSHRSEYTEESAQLPITLSESVERQTHPQLDTTSRVSVTDETDGRSHVPSSSHSLTTRDFLRRSFVRKSDSAKSILRSSMRSFKYGMNGALTSSHEQLVRDVEPMSNTVAMSSVVGDADRARSFASVI